MFRKNWNRNACLNCGEVGHYSRDCPLSQPNYDSFGGHFMGFFDVEPANEDEGEFLATFDSKVPDLPDLVPVSEFSDSDDEDSDDEDENYSRKKTSFTTIQKSILQGQFLTNAYPSKLKREAIAEETGLTPRIVSVWFQNQRQRENKKNR